MSTESAETAGGASAADPVVAGDAEQVEGQKKRRLEVAAADSKAEAVSEAEYKAKLKRLLKLVPADAIVDLLATMGARYQPVYEEVLRIVDSDVSARKLFVRNLPFDADEASLRPLVAPYGDIVELMVARDKATGKGRGYAFCTFAHAEDADRVLQTKTRSLGGRDVHFSLASERDSKSHEGGGAPSGSGGGGGGGPPPPPPAMLHHPMMMGGAFMPPGPPFMMGGPPPMPQPPPPAALSGGGPVGTVVDREERRFMIRNLSWQTTNESLRRTFAPYGELDDAAVAQDKETGKSRGFGFIVYKYLEGAQALLSAPPTLVDGRPVNVSLAVSRDAGGASGGGGGGGGPGALAQQAQMHHLAQQAAQQQQAQQLQQQQAQAQQQAQLQFQQQQQLQQMMMHMQSQQQLQQQQQQQMPSYGAFGGGYPAAGGMMGMVGMGGGGGGGGGDMMAGMASAMAPVGGAFPAAMGGMMPVAGGRPAGGPSVGPPGAPGPGMGGLGVPPSFLRPM